jgi:hypothetical protein
MNRFQGIVSLAGRYVKKGRRTGNLFLVMTILIEIFPWAKVSQTIRAEATMVLEKKYYLNSVETPATTRAIINGEPKCNLKM